MSQDGKYEESRRHCDDLDPQNWPPIDVGANFLVQHIDLAFVDNVGSLNENEKAPINKLRRFAAV